MTVSCGVFEVDTAATSELLDSKSVKVSVEWKTEVTVAIVV